MTVEEVMPLDWPARECPVQAGQRDAELAERNERNLRVWAERTFGPLGYLFLQPAREMPLTPAEISAYNERTAR